MDSSPLSHKFLIIASVLLVSALVPQTVEAQGVPPAGCAYCVDQEIDFPLQGWFHKFSDLAPGAILSCQSSTVAGHPAGCEGNGTWHPTEGAEYSFCSQFHPSCEGEGGGGPDALHVMLDAVRATGRTLARDDLTSLRVAGFQVEEASGGFVRVRDCAGDVRALLRVSTASAED